jgi:hypothetical protein
VIVAAVLAGGLAIGLLVARWWIVLVPAGFGVRLAATTGVDEVPPWFLGLAYAVVGLTGALIGVVIRHVFSSRWVIQVTDKR